MVSHFEIPNFLDKYKRKPLHKHFEESKQGKNKENNNKQEQQKKNRRKQTFSQKGTEK